MNAQEMHSMLSRLTGHLVSETPQVEANLEQLHHPWRARCCQTT